MDREEDKKITEIKENGGKIYSISRLNTINQCPYQAYLRYVKGEKEKSNVWATLGGALHDALEGVIHGKDEEVVGHAIRDELDNLELLDMDFPLDRNGNPTIRNNWIANMERFSEEFKRPKGEFETEQLVLMQIDDNSWMQGYIDLIKHNDDGTISIYDWKTSSNFDKKHLLEAGRQLIFYAVAKLDEGYEIRDIAWIMLKYAEVTWLSKAGKKMSKVCEWRNLIKDMKKKIERTMVQLGYDETDIEMYMKSAELKNSFDPLPDDVKEAYKVRPYVRHYELANEMIEETMSYIKNSIKKFEDYGEDESNYPSCDIDNDTFFCSNLCGYGSKPCKCKYFADYVSTYIMADDELDDLFS